MDFDVKYTSREVYMILHIITHILVDILSFLFIMQKKCFDIINFVMVMACHAYISVR